MRRRSLRWAGILVGVVVSAACIYAAARQVSYSELERSLLEADYRWLVPSVALMYLSLWLRAERWRLLFADPAAVTPMESVCATNIGLMFNNVLPSRAGDLPRLLALRRATGISGFEVGMTIVIERVLDTFVVAVVGLGIWPWLPNRRWIDVLGFVCAAVVVASVVIVWLARFQRHRLRSFLARLLGWLPFLSEERARSVVAALGAGSSVLVRPGALIKALVVSGAFWLAAGLSIWALLPAFDFGYGGLAPWLILVANTMAVALPSGPATIGPYEASIQIALVAFGVSATDAFSYAVLVHAVNLFPIMITGVIALLLMRGRIAAGPAPDDPSGVLAAHDYATLPQGTEGGTEVVS